MISIKRFLTQDKQDSAEAHERMGSLLLQAIGLHAVEGERADYDAFRVTIADLEASLGHEPSPSDVLITTEAAIKALQDYNRRTSLFIRAKSVELQTMVAMLTGAMGEITTASETSITRLQDLQKQIGLAVMVEDMRTVKLKLSDCLESMRVESERQRMESVKTVAGLEQGLKRAQGSQSEETRSEAADASGGGTDLLTGLPPRPEAEAAMKRACEQQTRTFAALFVLGRIQAINTRFGCALGDRVLIIFRNRLTLGLSSTDELFRWGPESFLAVLHRNESGEQVRRELSRVLSARLEETFEIGTRSVTLPIVSTWIAIPLFESNLHQIVKKLDAFRAASAG